MELADMAKEKKLIRCAWSKEDVGTLKTMAKDKQGVSKIAKALKRSPGIDRAADRFDGRSLHGRASLVDRSSLSRRPKKRGPFHLVPVMAKATLERLS